MIVRIWPGVTVAAKSGECLGATGVPDFAPTRYLDLYETFWTARLLYKV
jgi:hypothetical protein